MSFAADLDVTKGQPCLLNGNTSSAVARTLGFGNLRVVTGFSTVLVDSTSTPTAAGPTPERMFVFCVMVKSTWAGVFRVEPESVESVTSANSALGIDHEQLMRQAMGFDHMEQIKRTASFKPGLASQAHSQVESN